MKFEFDDTYRWYHTMPQHPEMFKDLNFVGTVERRNEKHFLFIHKLSSTYYVARPYIRVWDNEATIELDFTHKGPGIKNLEFMRGSDEWRMVQNADV